MNHKNAEMNEKLKFHFNEGVRYSMQASAASHERAHEKASSLACKAIEQFDIALESEPRHPTVLSAKAFVLAQTGKIHEAALIFENLTEIQPDEPEHFYQLGLCFLEFGMIEDGISLVKEAFCLSGNPGLTSRACAELTAMADRFLFYGLDIMKMGHPVEGRKTIEQAKAFLEFVMTCHPDDLRARKLLENVSGLIGQT